MNTETSVSKLAIEIRHEWLPWLPSLRRLSMGRFTGVLAGMLGFGIFLSVTQDAFLTWANWQNIFRSNAVLFILALGMTFVVITAGIDLSVASMAVLAGMVFGLALEAQWSWWPAFLATIGIGLAMGLVNGVLVGIARISFFVVTLGTLSVYASVALLSTKGDTIPLYVFDSYANTQSLVNGTVGPIPTVLLLYGGLYVVAAYVLRSTAFGRSVYAVGSNPEAARLAGINLTMILVGVYVISGAMAGIAGVVLAGRLGASAPQVDPTLMLTVVAAVLIGGTSYTGGEGGLVGTVLGVLFLGIVQNGLALTGVSAFWQGTVSGLILIAAIGLGVVRGHGRGLRFRRVPVEQVPLESGSVSTREIRDTGGDEKEEKR